MAPLQFYTEPNIRNILRLINNANLESNRKQQIIKAKQNNP